MSKTLGEKVISQQNKKYLPRYLGRKSRPNVAKWTSNISPPPFIRIEAGR